MLQLPTTWAEYRELTGLAIPRCLDNVSLETRPLEVARIIEAAGAQDEWKSDECGGIDLWRDRFPKEVDPPLCRAISQTVRQRCVGSPMRALLQAIAEAEERGTQVIRASVGNADHAMHPGLALFNNGHAMHYGDFRGHLNYREAVALLHQASGWAVSSLSSEHIFVGAGTADLILRTFLAITHGTPNPTILVFTDDERGIWPNVNDMITVAGARPIYASFHDSDEELSQKIRECTLAYIISPAIFGPRITLEDARRIIRLLRQHRKFIVVDAVYNAFEDPEQYVNWIRLYPEGAIEVGSMSKEFAAGRIHLGSLKALNPELIEIFRPFFQMTLCVPDSGMQSMWAPAVLLTSRVYIGSIRGIYQQRVAFAVSQLEDQLKPYGVKVLRPPCGPYVVSDFPFPATTFSEWFTRQFQTLVDGTWITGVGTAMPQFYPASDVGTNRFRISCVLPHNDMGRFCTAAVRAVPAFMTSHHEQIVDWTKFQTPRETVFAEGRRWLTDVVVPPVTIDASGNVNNGV